MATIAKFYLHDAATTNTGTMPTGAFVTDNFTGDVTGDAAGARTSRLTDDVIGALETSSVVTANADTNNQQWGHRRFVSPPLAARTLAAADGNWTFSFAVAESNTSHNGNIFLNMYLWRPSTGLRVGTTQSQMTQTLSATTKTAFSITHAWGGTQTVLDGDVLVFEICDIFAQSMGTAYTSTFYYDGTTEAGTTSKASFVTPPSALTLFTAVTTTQFVPVPTHLPFVN